MAQGPGSGRSKEKWKQSKKTTQFVKDNFKRRVCCTFVGRDGREDSECVCRLARSEHAQPVTVGEAHVPWAWETNTRQEATDAFGDMDFQRFGERNKPYVRLSPDTDMNKVLKLMANYWQLSPPNLLISVTGGAKDFQVKSGLRAKFQKGLIKAALPTGAWVITGGMNDGVMRYVGEAVRNYEKLASSKESKAVTIGVAPWGCLKNREQLVRGEGKWPAKYPIVPSSTPESGMAYLDPDHSHFLLVDNGTHKTWKTEIPFRTKLEQEIKEKYGVPACLLVLEGGEGTLENWFSALQNGIPTVIIKGSGRVADILAFAYQNLKFDEQKNIYDDRGEKTTSRIAFLDADTRSKIREMMRDRAKLPVKNLDTSMQQVFSICSYHDKVSVFEMDHVNSATDIDLAILNSILQDFSKIEKQLELALQWDRADVARDKILTDDVIRTGSLTPSMLEVLLEKAIVKDRVEFVELFLSCQVQVELNNFLTPERLTGLYKEIPQHFLLYELLTKSCNNYPDEFKLADIDSVLMRLMGPDYKAAPLHSSSTPGSQQVMISPALKLFVWSVLMGYKDMSMVFWREGKEQVGAALFAHAIFTKMHKLTHDREFSERFETYANEYNQLAVGVLSVCFKQDPGYTDNLLTRSMANFGHLTCTALALQAENREFLSQSACQSLVEEQYNRPLLPRLPRWKLYPAVLLPLLVWWILPRGAACKKRQGLATRRNASIRYRNYNSNNNRSSIPLTGVAGGSTALLNNSQLDLNFTTEDDPGDANCCCSALQRLRLFYSCPRVKLYMDVSSHVLFVVLYSYFLVVVLSEDFQWPEPILIVYGLSFLMQELREFCSNEARSVPSRFRRYFAQGWNRYDDILILTFILAFVLRFCLSGDSFILVRIAFVFNFNMCFFRILSTFAASRHLGPLVTMIRGMMKDILYFFLFLLMFVASYAISSEAILYPNTELGLLTFYHIPRKAYWQIYGELFLDDLEGTGSCSKNASVYSAHPENRCPTTVGRYFVPMLMGVYILLTNVLLLNLLIAMFNDTYQRIKGATNKHWAFLRFRLINDLSYRPRLPHPLLILSYLMDVCVWLRAKCTKCASSTATSSPHETERLQDEEQKLIHWENAIADEYIVGATRAQDRDHRNMRDVIPSVGMTDPTVVERLAKLENQIESTAQTLLRVERTLEASLKPRGKTHFDSSDDLSRHRSLRLNLQSRMSPYHMFKDVNRFPVPDDKVPWSVSGLFFVGLPHLPFDLLFSSSSPRPPRSRDSRW
ncbi:transient receptor potential cation channel subfamily M member-like 2 [Aplysia californica]|uniref:Transient receptor potential cation channel subfamily M member-like 2 n=1 Tax=Aplysia californica TaxID=6500 RepID=A0ABM0JRT2_APLCA|nr:transient receptor potential cation channel subfamily M member-like 2 [Aplysia californica]